MLTTTLNWDKSYYFRAQYLNILKIYNYIDKRKADKRLSNLRVVIESVDKKSANNGNWSNRTC